MTHQDRTDLIPDPCPKGVWVMQVLSDDEALGSDDVLPRGLAFHIARCESCRALADRLRAVSQGVSALAEPEPPLDLQARADSRAHAALLAGGAFTGRTDVAGLPAPERSTVRAPLPYRLMPYATAACLLFAAAAWWRAAPGAEPGSPSSPDVHRVAVGSGMLADEHVPVIPPSEVEDVGLGDPSGLADASSAPPLLRVTQHRLPILSDHIEAAMGSNSHNVQPAFVLPGMRGRRLIDRPVILYETTAVLPEPKP